MQFASEISIKHFFHLACHTQPLTEICFDYLLSIRTALKTLLFLLYIVGPGMDFWISESEPYCEVPWPLRSILLLNWPSKHEWRIALGSTQTDANSAMLAMWNLAYDWMIIVILSFKFVYFYFLQLSLEPHPLCTYHALKFFWWMHYSLHVTSTYHTI